MIEHEDKKVMAIKVENLSIYYGKVKALSNIYLDVKNKDYLGIIGPNGGGKTTLLKAILGLIPISDGKIEIFGQAIKYSKRLGYVPQFSSVDKNFPITVAEVVMMGKMKKGLSPFFKFSNNHKNEANEILNKVGIYNLAKRKINSLSGGEFQKMLIARALAVNPQILLLDEPTASVDINSCKQIYDLLARLNNDMTIILVTHDIFAVSSHVKSIACLNETLIYHGEPELNQNILNQLYNCPVDLIAHGIPHRVLKKHGDGEVI